MSRWKKLPAELDPRVRQLVIRLRRLKDHSGLSFRQLAAKTGYSPKSWERYLGGRTLPPREAVEALARIAGDEDPTRLLALHEVAAEGWATPRQSPDHLAADPAPESEPEPEPGMELLSAGPERPTPPGRSLLIALVAGAVTLVLAVSSAVLITARIMNDGSDDNPNGTDTGSATAATAPLAAPAAPSTAPPRLSYTCRLKRVGGLWYAGNSRTREDTVAYGNNGVEVAEAQCLLRRAGISPGGIDGDFGPLTFGAVKALQKRAGLHVDGMVGPQTWKALRG
ncbi:peptidoglycan-binding protein [Streptomyces sp. MBT65]|uniref:peptidoglycan-binding protein n=1 Tax=Streptomyces sp. MBT65 TaxID=1488395 RepID=UPI00190D4DB0|nr:peptidoglycan-binding protein [Streptomyces sp. MBT65]MBK3577376.1 peptidoglycan-binding protein [Streptomyces sp. MBT65]